MTKLTGVDVDHPWNGNPSVNIIGFNVQFRNLSGFESVKLLSVDLPAACSAGVNVHSRYFTRAVMLAQLTMYRWKFFAGFLFKVVNPMQVGSNFAML